MKEKTELELMLWFTIGYLLLFSILAILSKNYEFLYYAFILSALLLVIVLYHKKIHLTAHILLGLSILGALHVLGGNINIGVTRLYDLWLIQPNILKYDNVVHAFGIFVATFVAYSFIHPHLDKKINHNPILLSIILVSIAMGIGVFNEALEFTSVLYLGAAAEVGDYFNNAIDLIYNLFGSIIACFVIIKYHKNK